MGAPIILAAVAAVAAVGGAAISYAGAKAQQSAAISQANYQAQVGKNNAATAEAYAQDAEKAGQVQEGVVREQGAQREGQVIAQEGANGLTIDSGSNARAITDQAMLNEHDALTIRSNAEHTAYGYRVQGQNFTASSALGVQSAQYAGRAGMINSYGSIVNGVSSLASRWAGWQQSGIGAGTGAPPDPGLGPG